MSYDFFNDCFKKIVYVTISVIVFGLLSENCFSKELPKGNFHLSGGNGKSVIFGEPAEEGDIFLTCNGENFNLAYRSIDSNIPKEVLSIIGITKNGDTYLNEVNDKFTVDTLFGLLNDADMETLVFVTEDGEDSIVNYGISQDIFELGGTCQGAKYLKVFPNRH